MRLLLREIVAAGLLTAAVLPVGLAAETWGDGTDRHDAWEQAGVCGVESPLAQSRRSFDEYPIDLCGGGLQPDAGGVADAGEACDAERVATGCCDAIDAGPSARRFYITGIIGASFATLQSGGFNTEGNFPNTGRATDSILTAGGAVGTAIERSGGFLRLEVEGRGRDLLPGSTNSFQPPTPTYFYSVRAADGWSVMANAWRDWSLTERLGFYGGGGIGAGGYRLTVDDGVVTGYGHVGGFAWQAGTGTTYQITRRTTLDLGYRFFDTVSDALPLTVNGSGRIPAGSYVSNFYASELLLSIRIYEPFRR